MAGGRGLGRLALGLIAIGFLCLPAAGDSAAAYGYDLVGRIATARYDDGTCTVYIYDPNGNRLSATTSNGGDAEAPIWGTGTWGCFIWTAP